MKEAIDLAVSKNEKEIFIIGGGEIFKEAISLADKMYVTEVDVVIEGDAFFPSMDLDQWKQIKKTDVKKDENNQYNFSIIELVRI